MNAEMKRQEFFTENKDLEIYFATLGAVEHLENAPHLYMENGVYLIAVTPGVFWGLPPATQERRSWDDTQEVYRWEGQGRGTRGRVGGCPCHKDHPDWGGWIL